MCVYHFYYLFFYLPRSMTIFFFFLPGKFSSKITFSMLLCIYFKEQIYQKSFLNFLEQE